MDIERTTSGIVIAAILATPLCVTIILAARWLRRSDWRNDKQRTFFRAFSVSLLVLGVPWTALNIYAGATDDSIAAWGKATAAVWAGYVIYIAPLAAAAGFIRSKKYRNEKGA